MRNLITTALEGVGLGLVTAAAWMQFGLAAGLFAAGASLVAVGVTQA